MTDDVPGSAACDVAGASSVAYTRRWEALARECRVENWDSHKAQPVTDDALRTASYMDVIPSCHGGVQLELHAGGVDLEITIESDGLVTEVVVHRRRGH